MNDLPSIGIGGTDKYVHFTFHFIFTFLWAMALKPFHKPISFFILIQIIVVSLLMGILIELLQEFFTTTRKADIWDVVANFTGTIAAGFAIGLMQKNKIID